jgi:hypothetical protein
MDKTQRTNHYNRFKGVISYDLESREIEEQKEILKTIIEVAKDMLEEGENE